MEIRCPSMTREKFLERDEKAGLTTAENMADEKVCTMLPPSCFTSSVTRGWSGPACVWILVRSVWGSMEKLEVRTLKELGTVGEVREVRGVELEVDWDLETVWEEDWGAGWVGVHGLFAVNTRRSLILDRPAGEEPGRTTMLPNLPWFDLQAILVEEYSLLLFRSSMAWNGMDGR